MEIHRHSLHCIFPQHFLMRNTRMCASAEHNAQAQWTTWHEVILRARCRLYIARMLRLFRSACYLKHRWRRLQ